jgi:hypothetical protein
MEHTRPPRGKAKWHADSTARLSYRRLPADQPQTPKIDAIVNAATQAPALTAGSIATLYGTNLAAASMTAQGLPPHCTPTGGLWAAPTRPGREKR